MPRFSITLAPSTNKLNITLRLDVAGYTFGDAQGLFRFYGDMNGDRRVDISDVGQFSELYSTMLP